jgi:citronellol/citronellal dehydrogenase
LAIAKRAARDGANIVIVAKYGMHMCTLGHAGEFKKYGIGLNSLCPRTAIATAAM